MKLTFSTLCCPSWSIRQIVEAASLYHYEGVDFRGYLEEIDVTRLPLFNEELAVTLAVFAERQLSIPCFCTSVTLVAPASDRWDMMLEECQRYARLASRTRTPYLRIFGGARPKGMADDQMLLMAERHLRQVVKICRASGCMPLLETHDDWSTSDRVLALLRHFDPRDVGVLYDCEHAWRAGEAPVDTVEQLHKYLRHVHLKDSIRNQGEYYPQLLGEGELPIADCLGALQRFGYDGWICLEAEKRWHPERTPDPELTVPQFSRYLRGAMERGPASLALQKS